MNRTALIPLAAALLVGCTTDLDDDGFAAEDDCNDENADVYPGNPNEVIGDGIDSDCDGEDPQHAYVGEWNLKTLTTSMTYEGQTYDIFEDYDAAGSLVITPTLESTVAIEMSYEGEVGYSMNFSGSAAPDAAVGAFALALTGTFDDTIDTYDATADWECTTAEPTLTCEGIIAVNGYDVQTTAVFEQ